MNEPPFRLCCGQQHWGPVCPDGKVMCQLCFNRFEREKLHTDENGVTWDVCQGCQAAEDMMMRIRAI